jgi:signal transduction histidine kinase
LTKARIASTLLVVGVLISATIFVLPPTRPTRHETGAVRAFADAELALANGERPPDAGWRRVELDGQNLLLEETLHPAAGSLRASGAEGGPKVAWLRLRFDRAAMPAGPIAIYCPRLRERSVLFVNGQVFRRDFVRDQDRVLSWNLPLFAELPAGLVRPGQNVVVIRLDAPVFSFASAMPIRIGAYEALLPDYDWRMRVQILLPMAINGVIAMLSMAMLLLWAGRPKESVYGWLAAVGAIWFVRNLHFYIVYPPFDTALFWRISFDALFVLMIALYGFASSYFQLPNRGRIVGGLVAAMLVLETLRYTPYASTNTLAFFLLLAACAPISWLVTYALARAFIRKPSLPGGLMLAAIVAAMALSTNDLLLMLQWLPDDWIYLQPYASLLVFGAFGFATVRRISDSLGAAERMNIELEGRVEAARAALAASEEERRRLEVANAVKEERERIMQEMHDGIGSNLVTALAAAQLQGDSPRTIETLKRCLTDLKLTVDSLAPFEGDVAALLASLRYRIEPQLKDAGLALEWRVEPVAHLAWLDATSALNLLRIVQEALANIVAHARAAAISIIAQNAARDGKEGVRIVVLDDGVGLQMSNSEGGKGIAIMRARAQAIGGLVSVHSGTDCGVEVELWLPAQARGASTS